MADPRPPRRGGRDATRIGRAARVAEGERAVEAAAQRSLDDLTALAGRMLREGNYDPAVLDARHPEWSESLERELMPPITEAYLAGLATEAAAGTFDASPYVARHLDTVRNRLVGVADGVFDSVRRELSHGWAQGEDIPTLAGRVDGLLTDGNRWRNRARTIARTEVIGAANAGGRDAAVNVAGILGHTPDQVVKEWLATGGPRTRDTHIDAGGQTVLGLEVAFDVGGAALQYPGDPAGPPEEVINCRCTTLYHYPGDPDYPPEYAAALTPPTPRPVGDLPDVDLEDEMVALATAGDYTSARALELAAELDRRDAVNLDALPATPDPIAEQVFVDQALTRDLTQSRVSATRKRGKSESRELERADYEAFIDSHLIRAEADTNGNMLNKRAQRDGVDVRDLFTRRKRSLPAYATEELQRWFADNGRLSFDEWRGRRAKSQGWESEFG